MPGSIGSHPTAGNPPRTDNGICVISPSDLVGYTGNALNRIKELEQDVAELKAAILRVNQLSDISQQIGWIGGITYMGTAGWTKTAAGTLIPPPGFYIGNVIPGFHGGFFDATGTMLIGFGDDGTISGGSMVGSSYVLLRAQSATVTGFQPDFASMRTKGSALTSVLGTPTATSVYQINVSVAGVYEVSFALSAQTTAGPGTVSFRANIDNGTSVYHLAAQNSFSASSNWHGAASCKVYLPAGSEIDWTATNIASLNYPTDDSWISVINISGS